MVFLYSHVYKIEHSYGFKTNKHNLYPKINILVGEGINTDPWMMFYAKKIIQKEI